MLAAAPVRAAGPDALLTVPLTLRQREIEREIDELDRGVHLAALFFVLLGAAIGLSMAERIADPVRRLTRATGRIARGDFDARIAVRSADELRRLVDAFNSMAAELKAQRVQLERTHRLEAWAEMARQVAHEIKNPLTPIQLSAEHLRRVHADRGEPMGAVLDSCVTSILGAGAAAAADFVRVLAASRPRRPHGVRLSRLPELVAEVVDPYRTGLAGRIEIDNRVPPVIARRAGRPHADRARARRTSSRTRCTRCPAQGSLTIDGQAERRNRASRRDRHRRGHGRGGPRARVRAVLLDEDHRHGLGLPIARRNIELNGGSIEVRSAKGAGTTVTLRLPMADGPG